MTETIASVDATILRISPRTTWIFTEVVTSEGRIGTGESTLHFSQERIRDRVRALGQAVIGQPVRTDIAELAVDPAAELPEVAAGGGLDHAFYDLEAQKQGKSLAELLGGVRNETLAVYANINRRTTDRSPEGFATSVRAPIAAGMTAFKIAPFDNLQPDMAETEARPLLNAAYDRIAAVRDTIGPAARLQVDCHWRLGMGMIDEVLDVCVANDLFWLETPIVEEPDRFADIVAIRAKANARGVRLAGAELKTGVEWFGPILEQKLYDVIMPDMIFVGGYRQYLRIAELAAKAGTDVAPHNPTGPVLHANSVQASATAPNFLCLEMQFDEGPAFKGIVEGVLPMPVAGVITVPRAPGVGLKVVAEKIQAFQFTPQAQ